MYEPLFFRETPASPHQPEVIESKRVPSCPQDLVNLDPTDENGKCAFRCDKSTMFTRVGLLIYIDFSNFEQ
jgi:hypothetical protein